MNELEKCAEILVDTPYAKVRSHIADTNWETLYIIDGKGGAWAICDSFSDTLEGRRQADAIEQYLWSRKSRLWSKSKDNCIKTSLAKNGHEFRLDRIKWCIQELSK